MYFNKIKEREEDDGTRNQSLGIPNLTDSPSVYSAVNAELTNVQCFLDRCHKRRYISKAVNNYDLLENRIGKYSTK